VNRGIPIPGVNRSIDDHKLLDVLNVDLAGILGLSDWVRVPEPQLNFPEITINIPDDLPRHIVRVHNNLPDSAVQMSINKSWDGQGDDKSFTVQPGEHGD
jgi:hypothetical protein